jgi:hypothetical protein
MTVTLIEAGGFSYVADGHQITVTVADDHADPDRRVYQISQEGVAHAAVYCNGLELQGLVATLSAWLPLEHFRRAQDGARRSVEYRQGKGDT